MRRVQVNILNPKAAALLQSLAELKLISIEEQANDFGKVIKRIRAKASKQVPTLEVITKEVEAVRTKRSKRGKA
jgi:predicted transcriptional regulator